MNENANHNRINIKAYLTCFSDHGKSTMFLKFVKVQYFELLGRNRLSTLVIDNNLPFLHFVLICCWEKKKLPLHFIPDWKILFVSNILKCLDLPPT